MTVESTTQALCDLALRFGEGDEESMVSCLSLLIITLIGCTFWVKYFYHAWSVCCGSIHTLS